MMKTVYDNNDLMSEWDFDKNIGLDVLTEQDDSSISANWTCSHCGLSYSGIIKNHEKKYSCPNCKDLQFGDLVKSLSTSMRYEIKAKIQGVVMSVFSLIVCVLPSLFTFKWETFDHQWLHTLIFSFILLLCSLNISYIIQKIKINNSVVLIKHRAILFSLCKFSENNKLLIKTEFYNSIKNRLLYLMEEVEGIDKKRLLDRTRLKLKKFMPNWVKSENQSEFKKLYKIYINNQYFNKLFGSYESKKLTDFSNSQNIVLLSISITLTILTTFLSLYSSIGDWARFLGKTIFSIIMCLVIIFLLVFQKFKRLEKKEVETIFTNIVFINSAISKIKNSGQRDGGH